MEWINVFLLASQRTVEITELASQRRVEIIESEREKEISDLWTTATKRKIISWING